MAEQTARPDTPLSKQERAIDPHRLAWGVLLLSFAIFCVIAAMLIVGVDYFLFQSTVPIKPILSLGRGTVGVMDIANAIEQVGQNGTQLSQGTVISTDPQSQGTIQFLDPQADDTIIAAITIHNNSALTLREASRPRFQWSRARHQINIARISGKFSIEIPDSEQDDLLLNLETPAGAFVNLEGGGKYIITAADDQLSVINREGKATLITPDLRQGHSIPVDGMGIVHYEDNRVEQQPGYVDLLTDTDFNGMRTGTSDSVWACNDLPGNDPPGKYDFVSMEGLMPLRLVRGDYATTHGETSCIQSFGQAGMNIETAGYNYLSIRANFYIEYQSLSACGTKGSECPLMLRMDYIDANGEAQRWYHGFYAREADAQSDFPLRCATCLQDHDRIYEKAWYTYQSPNFLTLLNTDSPDVSPPVSIVGIWFYASGHQYDVRIGEIALLGARLEGGDSATEVAANN